MPILLLVAASLLSLPFALVAESNFCFSVGRFNTELKANKTAGLFEKKYSNLFSVVGSETKKGFYYRVAIGPFRDKGEARSQLASVKSLGLTAAWLWFGEARQTTDALIAGDKIYSDSLYEELENYKDKYDIELPLNEPLDNESGPDVREYENEKSAIPPEGFQLNKLRREALN